MSETAPPVNDFYSNFKNYTEDQSDGGAEGTQLQTALNGSFPQCTKITRDAKGITNAYEYACQQNKQPTAKGDSPPCLFFYYWFGDKYWSHVGNHKLTQVLDKIYTTLENTASCSNKCKFKYEEIDETIDQTIFKDMKTIFEYYHDYKKLPSLLGTYGTTCAEKWSTYWETVSSACKDMKEKCKKDGGGNHSSKQYCTDFNSTYAVHCETANLPQKIAELITKIQSDAELATSTAVSEAVGVAKTTSSISSIIGTLATIGTPYLLYKYKPWSSWFGSHSGNGRSRKRRTIGQDLDTLTEDASIYDSANESTIGDSTENSTVRSSTYTRPPTRGRRTGTNNTRGRRMVGYQNM